jgi:hypothetical protein
MAQKPQTPAPQQQGSTSTGSGQMGSNTPAAPQQGQKPIFRDWASI